MELSLFINANYKAPAFDKLLTGKAPKEKLKEHKNIFIEDPSVSEFLMPWHNHKPK